jgi:NAD(P)-dependent dehydrogenase (short-subunit alcohol dehydrogenase family)
MKVCLVTGANSGLGRAIAEGLAAEPCAVLMLCRDADRGETARAQVFAATGNDHVELIVCDLSRMASVRQAASTVRRKYGRVDALVNNAAVFTRERRVTDEGLETMLATNHLGPFLLTVSLVDALRRAAPARVVNVAAPSSAPVDVDALAGDGAWNAWARFGATKACNLLFTLELARRLAGSGVTVNAFHPGVVKSNLLAQAPAPVRWASGLFATSPEKAAAHAIRLATDPALEGRTGLLFKGASPMKIPVSAADPEAQRRLWERSERLVGLVPA